MALGGRSPQGYLKPLCKIWPILVAPNRHAVYSKALRISRCFSLLCLFLEVTKTLCSHQARSQRDSYGRQQVIVEVRKMELSSGNEYIAKTRQGGRRQKSETFSIHKPIRNITNRHPQFPVVLIPGQTHRLVLEHAQVPKDRATELYPSIKDTGPSVHCPRVKPSYHHASRPCQRA
jgi:hypothetical protein